MSKRRPFRRRTRASHGPLATAALQFESLESRQLLAGLVAGSADFLDHIALEDGGTPGIAGGAESDDQFGSSSAVGDFDGDGHPDLAIGVGLENVAGVGDAGAVNVLFGKPGGVSARGNQIWTQSDLGQTPQSNDHFGTALAAGDFNNDGFDDLAIGVPGENGGEGAVHIVYGSSDGLTSSNVDYFTPSDGDIALQDSNAGFGVALAAGDFDGNGYDDLAIGAPFDDVGGESAAGSVVVMEFDGSANPSIDVWNQDNAISGSDSEGGDFFGRSLAVGDFDGDRKDDLAIGVPWETGNEVLLFDVYTGEVDVLYGSSTGLTTGGNQDWWQDSPGIAGGNDDFDHFGTAVAVGDFDNDGFDDLAIGVPGEDGYEGAVNVIYGSSSGLTSAGNQRFEQGAGGLPDMQEDDDDFGRTLTTGDFNGDGRDDLAVAAPFEGVDNAGDDDGAVILIYSVGAVGLGGGGSRMIHEYSPGMPGNLETDIVYGTSLAAADFDRDGQVDLVVGAARHDVGSVIDAGQVYVHYNNVSTTDYDIWHQNVPAMEADDQNARFGTTLAAGDFNNDGHMDLVVGTPDKWLPLERFGFEVPRAGVVNVIYGTDGPLDLVDESSNEVLHQDMFLLRGGAEGDDRFGSALATGDFNADGYDDLAIGVPGESLLDPAGNYRAQAGAVHVILGSGSGLSDTSFDLAQGRYHSFGTIEAGDQFGAALAAGDFDGDGYDDLVVGVPGQDVNGVMDAGVIQLLLGNSLGIPGWELSNIFNQTNAGIGTVERDDHFGSVLAAGDFDNDGYDDLAIGMPDESISGMEDAGIVGGMYGRDLIGLDSSRSIAISQSLNGVSFPVAGTVEADDRFGAALAVGDFNLDGRADLAIGVPYEDLDNDDGLQLDAGVVNVVFSGPGGLAPAGNQAWRQDVGSAFPTETPGEAQAGDLFGFALSSGDFDNNGSDDLAIGAPGDADATSERNGTISVLYSAGSNAFDEDDAVLWSHPELVNGNFDLVNDEFGAALVAADFNNDGTADLAIGAPNRSLDGLSAVGEVQVMRGTVDTTFHNPGDFSGDGQLTILDIDQLAVEAAAGTNNIVFDLNGDSLVNLSDVEVWIEGLYGTIMADANLDYTVDGLDFLVWNEHKFRAIPGWSAGDFNVDGFVDGSDFLVWNGNKFTSADSLNVAADTRPVRAASDSLRPFGEEDDDRDRDAAAQPRWLAVDAVFAEPVAQV